VCTVFEHCIDDIKPEKNIMIRAYVLSTLIHAMPEI
jgi:hypothetical protein